jgi:hypothetical protein
MSCNPTIAGKVPPTRIPPPICASALDSRFETELETVGAANDLSDSMPDFACNACARDSHANGIRFASAK